MNLPSSPHGLLSDERSGGGTRALALIALVLAVSACDQSANIGDEPDASISGPCGSELIECDNDCFDPTTSRLHCGTCDHACSPTDVCRSGRCVDPWSGDGGSVEPWDGGQPNPWDGGWVPYPDSGWPGAPDGGDGGLPSTIQPMSPGALCTAGTPRWCVDAPTPQASPITGIWAPSASDVWFLAGAGTELRYDGGKWRGTVGGTDRKILFGTSASDVWATESTGLSWWNGTKWQTASGASGTSFNGLWGAGSSFWAVGAGGRILVCGSAWCSVQTSPTTKALNGVWGASSSEIWAVGDGGTIVFYDGARWSAVASPTTDDIAAVWGFGAGEAFAITKNAQALTWTRGNPWATRGGRFSTPAQTAASASAAGTAFAVHGDQVYRIGPDLYGSPYPVFQAPVPLRSIFAIGANEAWAGGDEGYLARWDGTRWSEIPGWAHGYARTSWYSVHGSNSSDAWAVDGTGSATHWNGWAWSPPQPTGLQHSNAIWAAASNDVWIVGVLGEAAHWDGATWTRAPDVSFLTSKANMSVLWGTSGSNLWASGRGSFTARYDGSQWTPAKQTGWSDVFAIGGSGPNDVWMVGDGTDGHHWTGSAWQTVAMPDQYFRALVSRGPKETYAFTMSGNVYLWNGTSWSEKCTLTGGAGTAWGSPGSPDFWFSGASGLVKLTMTSTNYCPTASFQPTLLGITGIWGADATHLFAVGLNGALLHYAP